MNKLEMDLENELDSVEASICQYEASGQRVPAHLAKRRESLSNRLLRVNNRESREYGLGYMQGRGAA